jgi:large subunit ribosomal protein L10
VALTKDEVAAALAESKLTVIAKYEGTPVKALQALRREGKTSQTSLKVIKNRLVVQAIQSNDTLKNVDVDSLKGMLLYAFNPVDEVAPAKVIADFAKKQKTLEFVGAITETGEFMSADNVKALASLPSKNELIAQVINILKSPANNTISALGGGLPGIMSGLEAKAK